MEKTNVTNLNSSVITFDRKGIKKQAKHELKIGYWLNVFIGIILLVTVTATLNEFLVGTFSGVTSSDHLAFSNWAVVRDIVRVYIPDFMTGEGFGMEVARLSVEVLFDFATMAISFPFYVVYTFLNGAVESPTHFVLAITAILLYLVIICCIVFPVHLGTKKYFLEKSDKGTSDTHTLFGAFNRYYLNILLTKSLKAILYFLWSLTIVGAAVKHYSYYYVDYIIMDNPSISPYKAIKLSERMASGRKWAMFKTDVTLFGWQILSLATFGLLNIFFLTPYRELTYAGIYLDAKNDLFVTDSAKYREFYTYNPNNEKSLIMRRNVDYDCDYQIVDFVLMFFIIAFIGWIWEVSYAFIQTFAFVNRGSLHGPILPIYGTGGIIVLVLLKKTRKVPWLSFILSITICLIIEYFAGWYLEYSTGHKYWDYSDMPFNLNGRICLYGALAFGIACIGVIYFIGPALYTFLKRFSKKVKWIVAAVFVAAFITDLIVSHFYPNESGQVSDMAIEALNNTGQILGLHG
ncbi:MAG: DUF975 family protein [Bacilli bacterium]